MRKLANGCSNEVPVRFRPWWRIDENGKAMLEVLYGNMRLEMKPKTLNYGKS